MDKVRLLIWNENKHEKIHPEVARIYPQGIHGRLAQGLAANDLAITTATMDANDQGLAEGSLDDIDVLMWWGHMLHDKVEERIVSMIVRRVNEGMGFIALHSAHHSRIFQRLIGTNCNLAWRESTGGERVRIWCVSPGHTIAKNIPPHIDIMADEMYGEPFNIAKPDDVVFINWYQGGEVFRGGCTWTRGRGRIFYFSPGHETFPVYYQEEILRVIGNAVRWAKAPHTTGHDLSNLHRPQPLEKI